jgi:hydrogenase nickel insertion protein HypA
MHETTIANSILEIVSAKCRTTPHSAAAVKVDVLVGEFRNVDPDSLRFAFENMRQFYPLCSSCQLHIEIAHAMAVCKTQDHRFSPQISTGFRCTHCGGPIGKLLCGEELDVVGITLEADEQTPLNLEDPCTK